MKEKLLISVKSCAIFTLIILISVLFSLVTGIGCPLYYSLGVPCPLCGMTRAYLALFRLDLAAAASMHPLFWMLPIIAATILIRPFVKISDKAFRMIYIAIGGLFVLVWAVRMIIYFPHTQPMVFYDESILSSILRLFDVM